jgi:hypothetical protein
VQITTRVWVQLQRVCCGMCHRWLEAASWSLGGICVMCLNCQGLDCREWALQQWQTRLLSTRLWVSVGGAAAICSWFVLLLAAIQATL